MRPCQKDNLPVGNQKSSAALASIPLAVFLLGELVPDWLRIICNSKSLKSRPEMFMASVQLAVISVTSPDQVDEMWQGAY